MRKVESLCPLISSSAELFILTAAGVCTCVVVFKSLPVLHHGADYIF